MKILAVSDQVLDRLYSSSITAAYPEVKMIIGCGDLPYAYLEFLVSVFSVPMFYVPGNHDPAYQLTEGFYAEGGTNLDGQVVYHKGLLIAGLGGSVRYPPGGPNQYTQRAMFLRVYRLLPKILMARLRYKRPLDIFVTHSPPAGIHDDDDQTHRGMQAFNYLLEKVGPRYMLHGHTIFFSQNLKSHITPYGQTQVMNVYPFRVFDLDAAPAGG